MNDCINDISMVMIDEQYFCMIVIWNQSLICYITISSSESYPSNIGLNNVRE